ncbi:MAG: hypothetical protein KME19_18060 [Microcoleus vaginatus WJT46-NPBG5]|jgi:hypothetical protein|nr:hypothetical protein [Microcoleus vaginatus WJT46-NPBG5]
MTPTLLGRWQSRLLLFATVGVLLTLPFFLGMIGNKPGVIYFWVLGYLALFGICWDVLYNYLQKFRWDYDWPGVFQLIAGIWEGIFVAILAIVIGLPGVPKDQFELPLFIPHYTLVWLGIYIASQSLMRILFVRWRFKGGQWL